MSNNNILSQINLLPGAGHSGNIPKQQEVLRELTAGKTLYFETGFNVGHSSYFVLESNPTIKVVSFSLPYGPSEQALKILKQAYGDRIEVVWGDSTKTLPIHNELHADVAFIDGGHEYNDARQDLDNAERHLNSKGTVIIDDVYCQAGYCHGPTRAWKEFIEVGRIRETARYRPAPEDINSGINDRGFAVGKFL
jgi:predicted O-methyltransferase YrrM